MHVNVPFLLVLLWSRFVLVFTLPLNKCIMADHYSNIAALGSTAADR